MKTIYDEQLISLAEIEQIILENFDNNDNQNSSEKGAGSFCRFIERDGKKYALLTRRAEKLLLNCLKGVMDIINRRSLPVAVLGAAMDIKQMGDYMVVLPKIEGINLPSYVYGISENITIAAATAAISQEAMNDLAKECCFLNQESVAIDFHGANFVYQPENNAVRMLDLRKRGKLNECTLSKRFMKLTAVNQLKPQFKDQEFLTTLRETQGIDIDQITMRNIVKSYFALLQAGVKEEKIAAALRDILGANADIDKIAGKVNNQPSLVNTVAVADFALQSNVDKNVLAFDNTLGL